MDKCDILIIGAGMAGGCLARQLCLHIPELKITVVDRRNINDLDQGVPESCNEVWDHYMMKILDLGPYLQAQHVQRHGERFFFDNEEATLPIAEMSELGLDRYESVPSRQIDRARFDSDLCEMNRKIGIDVRLETEVLAASKDRPIIIDRDYGHQVQTSTGSIQCRWLVDAGGSNSPLAEQLSLHESDKSLDRGLYWGHYTGCQNIDSLGSDSWCLRVNYSQRYYSTNYFLYPGYRICVTAINEDRVCIAIEYDKTQMDLQLSSVEKFDLWLRRHICIKQLLGEQGEAKPLDFFQRDRTAYCSTHFFSTDRWFLSGSSACFSNVLGLSSPVNHVATNILLEEAIRTDMGGDQDLFAREVGHFNLILRNGYESEIRTLNCLQRHASFDVWSPFYKASLALYFNTDIVSITNRLAREIKNSRIHTLNCDCSWDSNADVQLRIKMADLADEFTAFLQQRKQFYSSNNGHFCISNDWEQRNDIVTKIYQVRSLAEEQRIAKEIFQFLCWYYVRRMAQIEKVKESEIDLFTFRTVFDQNWNAGQTLVDIFNGCFSKQHLTSADTSKLSISTPKQSITTPKPPTPVSWFHQLATHYVEAQILFHLNQVGVLSLLNQGVPHSSHDIAISLNLDEKVTATLLDYIFNVNDLLLRDDDGRYIFSVFGQDVVNRFSDQEDVGQQNINMFDVRVGCYGPVWRHLGQMLTKQSRYGEDFKREGAFAERGVNKLSAHFWPSLSKLLHTLQVDQVMEIGLTTGLLERVGLEHPRLGLYGLDKSELTIETASRRASDKQVNTIHWIMNDVFDLGNWSKEVNAATPGLIFSLHFHEIIAAGKHQLVELLVDLKKQFPNWYVVAFEQPILDRSEREKVSDMLWLYSQSNVLIHHLIGNGRILSRDAWADLGREADCALVSDVLCGYLGYRAFVFQLAAEASSTIASM